MTVVIGHVDMDGYCSAVQFMMKHRDIRFLPINYGYDKFPFHNLHKGENVYLVDFTAELPDMEKLNREYAFQWFDHHEDKCLETEAAIPNIPGVREYDKSACMIVWNYLNPGKEPPFPLQLINAYDIGDFDTLACVREFQKALWSLDVFPIGLGKINLWKRILFEPGEFFDSLIIKGRELLEIEAKESAIQCRIMCEELTVYGHNALVANFRLTSIDQFNSVIVPDKHEMVIGFYKYSRKVKGEQINHWKFSVRKVNSNSELHVGRLFKEHIPGANGHHGAAGFTVNKLSEVEWLRHVI